MTRKELIANAIEEICLGVMEYSGQTTGEIITEFGKENGDFTYINPEIESHAYQEGTRAVYPEEVPSIEIIVKMINYGYSNVAISIA